MNHSTTAQCNRILSALKKRPMHSLALRRELDIIAPNSRIADLRKQGYKILTELIKVGNRSKIARYTLILTPSEATPL